MKNIPIITIDGPSGSGKGTISQLIANRLGFHLLNSGALYRALVIFAFKKNISLDNEIQLAHLAKKLNVTFTAKAQIKNQRITEARHTVPLESKVLLSGEDITHQLQLETTGEAASKISVFPAVRQSLVAMQKKFHQAPGLVAEGRDMGTVIFPQADIKIFLDASIEERAKRRYNQLLRQGIDVKLPDLISEVSQRDLRDKTRKTAPLQAAKDAITIDTTGLSIDQVFSQIMEIIQNKWPLN